MTVPAHLAAHGRESISPQLWSSLRSTRPDAGSFYAATCSEQPMRDTCSKQIAPDGAVRNPLCHMFLQGGLVRLGNVYKAPKSSKLLFQIQWKSDS